ncbi:unnamed protein product [Dracunculus medinensis]|uniref:LIM domain only protein 3 n=1 Tax=Dracunculus medinensis TaxID=318479 RepID=A0A0N4UK37_DRAME|nr:unnamed protein product [Dracunculus medinensis]
MDIICAACSSQIVDRFMLKALGKFWHEDCLKCTCCNCRLGELGSKLYYKQSMILCARDYLRLFGLNGICAACEKNIPAFELVMRAKSNVYHLHCFACQICSSSSTQTSALLIIAAREPSENKVNARANRISELLRFCIGDKYYLCDNKILCQYDYEERLTFLRAAYNNQSFTEISKSIEQLDDFAISFRDNKLFTP